MKNLNPRHLLFPCMLWFALMFFGCQNKTTCHQKLQDIDRTLQEGKSNEAWKKLADTDSFEITTEEEKAYYTLLYIQTGYTLYKPTPSRAIELLDSCIACFQKGDPEKLARCYLYKGNILYEQGKLKEAVWNLKECEEEASCLKNSELWNKLYRAIIMVNNQGHNYLTALDYGRKLSGLATAAANKEWLAAAYNLLSVSFHGLGQDDSARYYINRSIPYLNEVSPQSRVIILDNIGYLNMNHNQSMALKYLYQAAAINPSVDTYDNMAQILARQGHERQADSLWNLALKKSNIEQKCQIVKNILQHKNQAGLYLEANRLSTWLLALNDSLSEIQKVNKIEILQNDFDRQIVQTEMSAHNKWLSKSLEALLVALVLVFGYWKYKRKKLLKECKKQQSIINEGQKVIKELKTEKEKKDLELNKKDKLINNMLKRRMDNLRQGEILAYRIREGETVCTWTKGDISDFLDYYMTRHMDFQSEIAHKYSEISPKLKLYLCLVHENWDNHQIAKTLGVGIATLRNFKYKLKLKENK